MAKANAHYKYGDQLVQSNSNAFDTLYVPGAPTPHSGIYRCHVCGENVTSVHPHPLPPQNHHVHAPGVGPIRWRLLVSTH